MTSPTAILAEDEPLLRTEIKETLTQLWPELQICSEAADGLQAIEALDRFAPNIMFLDIQMPGRNGLEVARHASGKAHVVFITAYDAYALEAFEEGALDYILKPISAERMKVTIARLQERLREPPADLTKLADLLKTVVNPETRYLKWLTVPHASELRVVAVAEILYLQADNKYTTIATRSSTFLLNSSLKEMQKKLDPAVFWQIHRGTIVNISAIDTIYRSFRGSLEVKLKDRSELLPVSAAHAHLFKHA
ncbi:MAG TPA: LytTR family DNA-binding domain-containing protein [Steroidobacteraceae bacterium]|jgi:DNA-binding LytR/AlgR family response regulator|nr:LytTR family DNA-binding domain-containing protein [Steroidobacteraceae bacterium]